MPVGPDDDDGGHAAADIHNDETAYQRWARRLGEFAGSRGAAGAVGAFAVAWVALGLAFRFPRWWELGITIGFPILTLLMMVLLQHTQNHDARATQLKLDELIRVTEGATNRMMTVEDASPDDLDHIQDDFREEARGPVVSRTRSG
jgi:low affinity Fe/Cu permease